MKLTPALPWMMEMAALQWMELGFALEEAWAIVDATTLLCIAEGTALISVEKAEEICDALGEEVRATKLARTTV